MRIATTGSSHSGQRGRRGGFSLIEILIVLAIIGILGAVVLPKFSDASQVARENTLKDELRYLRTQITVFKAQHRDTPPGYPGGNQSLAPTEADFLQQMTQKTDETCKVGIGAGFRFGPYLSKMPPNPVSGLNTILVVPNGAPMPAANGSTGWIYKPQTLELIPNQTGVDSDGVPFVKY